MKAEAGYDVVVIGGGLSGYVAAARSAVRGKRVLLLTHGLGSFPFLPGTVDVWGWSREGPPVADPVPAIEEHLRREPGHPWSRLLSVLAESMEFFRFVCGSQGLAYTACTDRNIMVPTALGLPRPTFTAPVSQYVSGWETVTRILVVGLAEYRDFFPAVVARGLAQEGREVRIRTVSLGLPRHADSYTLAGYFAQERYRQMFVDQVAPAATGCPLVLVPAVCGLEEAGVVPALASALGGRLMEVATLPPSVPGLRIHRCLRRFCLSRGVTVNENVKVTGAVGGSGGCTAVKASLSGREYRFAAASFILATGSFISDGYSWRDGKPAEPVLGLPVTWPREDWAESPFLDAGGKGFLRAGIEVNDNLNPVDPAGAVIYGNVYVTGAKLSGSDFSVEKSGSGLAVASGYKAGSLA